MPHRKPPEHEHGPFPHGDPRNLYAKTFRQKTAGKNKLAERLVFYFKRFDLSFEKLKGKKVIDVGGGDADFVHWLINEGIEAISIDLKYSNEKELSSFSSSNPKIYVSESLESHAQNNSEKYDTVIANQSAIHPTKSKKENAAALIHLLSVAKINGKVFIYPSDILNKLKMPQINFKKISILNEFQSFLKHCGFSFEEFSREPETEKRKVIVIERTLNSNLNELRKLIEANKE